MWRRETRPALVGTGGEKHQHSGSGDDAYRSLDTLERLLGAISGPQAAELGQGQAGAAAPALWRQARKSRAKIEGTPSSGLKLWREVITSHPDVASGNFVQAQVRRRPVAEIAWQLGKAAGSGKAGYAMVANADRTSTNPGDALKELFNNYSPWLILIDE